MIFAMLMQIKVKSVKVQKHQSKTFVNGKKPVSKTKILSSIKNTDSNDYLSRFSESRSKQDEFDEFISPDEGLFERNM